MRLWKYEGAFISPKGTTNHSHKMRLAPQNVRTILVYIPTLDYPAILAHPAILDYPAMLDYTASLTFSFVSHLFSKLKLLYLMSRRKLSLSY